MSPSREDALIAIYRLTESGEVISNKRLAEVLMITPPSSSEMMAKLKKAGFVRDVKGPIELTEEGKEKARDIISRHRLWECMLIQVLGLEDEDAHKLAHELEHVTTPLLEGKLNQFLNYPKKDPHGSPIYHNE